MSGNYFFIDGSALMSQIRQLRRARPIFAERKLCIRRFIQYFHSTLHDLHRGEYKRAIFYFPNGDEQNVIDHFEVPDMRNPGEVRDIHLKYCGHKLKKSADFDKFVEESVPKEFMSRFSKSEKGIDIEICCDALKLASAGRVDRLFMLSNDSDFVPLFKSLKECGANISLIHLSDLVQKNWDLLRETDSYDVVRQQDLQQMFLPVPTAEALQAEAQELARPDEAGALEDMLTDKPDAEPSDLKDIEETEGGEG